MREDEIKILCDFIDEPLKGASSIFFYPKAILMNSNNPNRVVIAILQMSSSRTGTWLFARTKSTLESIGQPRNELEDFVMTVKR